MFSTSAEREYAFEQEQLQRRMACMKAQTERLLKYAHEGRTCAVVSVEHTGRQHAVEHERQVDLAHARVATAYAMVQEGLVATQQDMRKAAMKQLALDQQAAIVERQAAAKAKRAADRAEKAGDFFDRFGTSLI